MSKALKGPFGCLNRRPLIGISGAHLGAAEILLWHASRQYGLDAKQSTKPLAQTTAAFQKRNFAGHAGDRNRGFGLSGLVFGRWVALNGQTPNARGRDDLLSFKARKTTAAKGAGNHVRPPCPATWQRAANGNQRWKKFQGHPAHID